MADAKRLLILTRDRKNVSFRQRIEPYLDLLAAHGIKVEVVELSANVWARRSQMRRAHEFAGVLLHRKTLTAWDAWALDGIAHRLLYDFDDAIMYQARSSEQPDPQRLRRFHRTMTRAHLVIAGSPILAEHAQREGARHVVLLPDGPGLAAVPHQDALRDQGPPAPGVGRQPQHPEATGDPRTGASRPWARPCPGRSSGSLPTRRWR